MAVDIFPKLDGIKGEAQDDKYRGRNRRPSLVRGAHHSQAPLT